MTQHKGKVTVCTPERRKVLWTTMDYGVSCLRTHHSVLIYTPGQRNLLSILSVLSKNTTQ